jgi:hypothetical protein
MTDEETHKLWTERMKSLYDLNKHVTTLSTGTLLLMAGLFEKVFKQPVFKILAAISFFLFAAVVVCSVISMLGLSLYSPRTFRTANDPVDLGIKALVTALILFIAAIVVFTGFALLNLYV